MSKNEMAAVPPDQPARDAIVQLLDTTMLVEASAGTGKTRSMVDRMIALLREGKCNISTLAAITFTRKAAAELRARFQIALEKAVRQAEGEVCQRLTDALDHAERAYIGTIHSFCGRLLRERPVEAGIDPAFGEFDETVDFRLRKQAWQQYVAGLISTGDAVLGELDAVGLEIGQLESAFISYATYPDVEEWPAPEVTLPNLKPVTAELRSYAAHMERLAPTFPVDVGNDLLMNKYRRIARIVRQADLENPADLLDILAECVTVNVVQRNWPEGQRQGRQEKERWEEFVEQHAQPLVEKWRHRRYAVVMRVLQKAATTYENLRRDLGGLNYQDLLLQAAGLLRDKSKIREYFRKRFTHLLVDEFQDTDPIQAEVMLLLTADDPKGDGLASLQARTGFPVCGGRSQAVDLSFPPSGHRYVQRSQTDHQTAWRTGCPDDQLPQPEARNRLGQHDVREGVAHRCRQVFSCPLLDGVWPVPSEDKAGVEVLNVPEEYGTNPEALAYEPDVISQVIHNAVAPQSKTEPPAKPGEFMIIAALKKNLSRYAQQLSELGIPSQVTGGAVLSEIHELSLLCLCLEAVTQPDNPVALVAALRSELFGISDTALYTFKAAGGRFSFHTKIPEGLSADTADPLADAYSRLHRYDMWLKTFPPVAAVERIVADLGLVASAAAERGGNTLAGGMARAVELLRAAQSTATSISELAAYLREVVDGAESHDAVPAASPSQAPVRIMNLHQAKGLEAPVVFLADPTGAFSHDPQIHIDRSGDGPTRGYLAILGSSNNFHRPLLAYPERWQEFAEEEGKFQKAEKNRLLYVAATRAGNRLIITQREEGNRWNPWSPLNAHLDGCDHLEVPKIAAPPKTSAGDGRRRRTHPGCQCHR